MNNPSQHRETRLATRRYALTMTWDRVFERVYGSYERCFQPEERPAYVPLTQCA